MHGLIKSEWKKNVAQIEWKITVPANSSATVYIPAKSLTDVIESGVDVSKAEGVLSVKFENEIAIVQVGSGDYKFVSKIK